MRFLSRLCLFFFILNTELFTQVTGLAGWDIFLDPGHSKKENMGIYGYSEAERNLRVGLWLRDILLAQTDIDTVYISRTNDRQNVTLEQRTDYANLLGASWYHSIHSDAGSPQLNSTLLLWGQYYNGREKVPNGGKAMSDIMVNILTRGMRTSTRGSIGDCSFYTWSDFCKNSGGPYLHVNRWTTMPSELSEAGFHTNPRQNQLFMNHEWKKLEAMTFYWSILQFFEIERPFVGTCVGIIKDWETGVPINGATVTVNGQSYTTDTYQSLFYKFSNDPGLLHNGFYYLDNLPDDEVEVIVTADSYYGDTSRVKVVDSFFTFHDIALVSTMPPRVIATTPAAGDTNFPAWDNIVIQFSRPMDVLSVQQGLTITPEVSRQLSWAQNNRQLIIRTDSLAFETNYQLTLAATVKDKYNHFLDGNADGIEGDGFRLFFKTGPADMTPPQLVAIYPPQNGTNIPLHLILNIAYDEPIDSASVDETVFVLERLKDGAAVPGKLEHYVVCERSDFCFFPAQKLFADEVYVTRIAPRLRDLFGNTITKWGAYSFKTAKTDLNVRLIDNFEADLTQNWWAPQQSGSTTGIITEKTGHSPNYERVNHLTQSTAALQLDYGWDLNAASQLIRLYLAGPPRNILFNSTDILQVYLFGDGSGNQFRFCVDDKYPNAAAENHEVSPWYSIDWIGWKLVTWNMSTDSVGSWIGDGQLDGTLRFDSIQMTYQPGCPTTGTFYFDDLSLAKPLPVSLANLNCDLPTQLQLFQNYPNPFNPVTTIRYQLTQNQQPVKLLIVDLLGQTVRTLVNTLQSAGEYSVQWDGRDNSGKPVTSGTYWYQLIIPSGTETRRMVLVR